MSILSTTPPIPRVNQPVQIAVLVLVVAVFGLFGRDVVYFIVGIAIVQLLVLASVFSTRLPAVSFLIDRIRQAAKGADELIGIIKGLGWKATGFTVAAFLIVAEIIEIIGISE